MMQVLLSHMVANYLMGAHSSAPESHVTSRGQELQIQPQQALFSCSHSHHFIVLVLVDIGTLLMEKECLKKTLLLSDNLVQAASVEAEEATCDSRAVRKLTSLAD